MNGGEIEVIVGAAIPRSAAGGGAEIAFFCHCPELECPSGGYVSVRNANFARQVVNRIAGDSGRFVEGWPDEADWAHLWRIRLRLAARRGPDASVSVDYEALPGCPLRQRQDMMRIYCAVRDAMRVAGVRRRRGK